MANPQTQASSQVLRGQEYWRLKEELTHAGQIFEVDNSAKAIAIGPESDIHEAIVAYYDPDKTPSLVELGNITVGSPWIGRLDALLAETYTTADELARLFVYAKPNVVSVFTVAAGKIRVINPVLDLFVYTAEPEQVPMERAVRRITTVAWGTGGHAYIYAPFYGRRLCSVNLRNGAGDLNGALTLEAIRFATPIVNIQRQVDVDAFAGVAGETVRLDFSTDDDGPYDLVRLHIVGNTDPSAALACDVAFDMID
jgi:hypothetical protein